MPVYRYRIRDSDQRSSYDRALENLGNLYSLFETIEDREEVDWRNEFFEGRFNRESESPREFTEINEIECYEELNFYTQEYPEGKCMEFETVLGIEDGRELEFSFRESEQLFHNAVLRSNSYSLLEEADKSMDIDQSLSSRTLSYIGKYLASDPVT